jgi:hypothetical protein
MTGKPFNNPKLTIIQGDVTNAADVAKVSRRYNNVTLSCTIRYTHVTLTTGTSCPLKGVCGDSKHFEECVVGV